MKVKVTGNGESVHGAGNFPLASRLVENGNPLGRSSWFALAALAGGLLRLFRRHSNETKATLRPTKLERLSPTPGFPGQGEAGRMASTGASMGHHGGSMGHTGQPMGLHGQSMGGTGQAMGEHGQTLEPAPQRQGDGLKRPPLARARRSRPGRKEVRHV